MVVWKSSSPRMPNCDASEVAHRADLNCFSPAGPVLNSLSPPKAKPEKSTSSSVKDKVLSISTTNHLHPVPKTRQDKHMY
jgi:hypothetical protein